MTIFGVEPYKIFIIAGFSGIVCLILGWAIGERLKWRIRRSEISLGAYGLIAFAFIVGLGIGIYAGEKRTRAELRPRLQESGETISELQANNAALVERIASMEDAYTIVGLASFYGTHESGRLTANQERFDRNAMTAASLLLPFNSVWRVERLDNGASVIVRINDRMPHYPGRIIDLAEAAALRIGMTREGIVKVKMSPAVLSRPKPGTGD